MLSIIIPTYNSALTIADCLQSILVQSNSNYEILIIDGASTDNTIKIINTILKNTPFAMNYCRRYRIKYHNFQYWQ